MKSKQNKYSQLYAKIDRKQLSEQALATLNKLRLATGNFRTKNQESLDLFQEFYDKLSEKKPTAIKGSPENKAMIKEMLKERGRKLAEGRVAKQKEKTEGKSEGNDIDANRPAKPFGWRMRGKHNYKKPTRADITEGRAYYEGRVNRADVKRKKYPMLERGGMAEGDNTKSKYYAIVDENTDRIYFKSDNKHLVSLKYKEFQEIYPNANLSIEEFKKYEDGGRIRSQKEFNELVEEKEKIVKNLSPKEVAEMWNRNTIGSPTKMTEEEGKMSNSKSYLVDLLVEKELSEEEYNQYFEKGGYMAEGGDVDKNGMIYALREFVSSGEIANKTDVLNYDDIAKIRRIAIQYYMDNGDVNYSYGELGKVLSYANDKFKSGYMAEGGEIGEELLGGQSNAQLKPSGYKLISQKGREIIVSDDGGETKERYVKNNGFSGYRLVYKGNDYEFTDSFEDGGYMAEGGEIKVGDLVKHKKYGWIMRVDKIEDGKYYLENDKRGVSISGKAGNNGSYGKSDIEKYAKGVAIENQYEGRTAEDVWDSWTKEQKMHFLDDHNDEFQNVNRGEKRILSSLNFSDIEDDKIVKSLQFHIKQGQYAKGGYMSEGGETEEQGVDLFEDYEDQPKEVSDLLETLEVEDYNYDTLNDLLSKMKKIGYTFEFGLDAEPYDLRKIGQRGKSEFYAKGGYMENGGEVGKSFTILQMNEKLNRMFPDSFGFSVGTFSEEGNKNRNSSALIANENDPFRGLKDSDIDSKLFFPQYKRVHDIRYRIYQGGENTYFYFNLESEKGDEYIGQFGFKDQGDVPSSYITRFIAFLMEQYGLPFEVNHSVMAKGGEISIYNLRKGDKVKTRKGDIETIVRKTGSGSYETIENDYSHSPESLEFVSRPSRKMAEGGRIYKDWNGRNTKEMWGKEDLYLKYDNTLDLIADVSDYYKKMGEVVNENYAQEQKDDLIKVLKSGKINFNDGATLKFAKGGEISIYNLRKGDKVKTRKGDIETIVRKTGSGSYETIENDYSHSPESLEFVSRPSRKMAEGGEVFYTEKHKND